MVGEAQQNPLQDGLVWEDRWSLDLHTEALDPESLHRISARNEALLRALAVLDESHRPPEEVAESVQHELLRLDSKLQLALDLLGELLARQVNLPDPCPVRMTAAGIEWQPRPETVLPQPGTVLRLDLYPSDQLPRPLVLEARLVEGAPTGWLRAAFSWGSAAEREALERFLFRLHRRSVARQRRNR